MLYLAAALMFATGLAHSYLGERYILIRLFKRDKLPVVLGSTAFTTGTLRFAWHLTTVAWWGLACLILLAAQNALGPAQVLRVIGVIALVSGLFPLYFTRGKHLSWIAFFVLGALLLLAARGYPGA
ncbi:MAG: hypothetical protein V4857_30000 [Pseudomonadota bacterium]